MDKIEEGNKIIAELPKCPHCKSNKNTELVEIRKDNGVFGPGFSSWIIDSYYVCKKCGSMFKRIFK